jgi:hypothetical protein
MMKSMPSAVKRELSLLREKLLLLPTPAFVANPLFQKVFMVVCLSLILSLLLTPRLHFKHPEYKLGMIAREHLKADRDFLVEDRLATDQKKMEALAEMSAVYDFDNGLPTRLETTLFGAFLKMHETMQQLRSPTGGSSPTYARTQGLTQAHRDFEKILEVSVTREAFDTLRRYHFSSDVAQKISGLLADVLRSEWITDTTFLKQDLEKGIVVRDTQTLKETHINDLSAIRHMTRIDALLSQKANALMAGEDVRLRRAAVSLVRNMILPNLTFNREATEQRKQNLLAAVKPVYFQIQTNEMIVREGEKINRTDLDKIEAFYKMKAEQRLSNILNFSGSFIIILFLAALLYLLSAQWFRRSRNINREIFFLGFMAVFQILLVKSGIFISEAISRAFPFIPVDACFFAVPFAVGAMLVGVMINRNVAFVFSIFSSVLVGFLFEARFTITLFSFLGGMTACYHLVHCRKRSAFFKTGFLLGMVNAVVILASTLIAGQAPSFNSLIKIAMGLFGGIQAGVIVAGITPLVESLFKYTTDIKLLELGNLNQPIFQKMIIESPGTYHHSIIVGSMVETAAEAIGANALLAKVSAYYHDIGKVKRPLYYIENQRNGENRHDKLSPRMSALVIISHIKDGCELAIQAKLGPEITNIIREHHGTSLVRYFYEKAKKDRDASVRSLSESEFRYPGPKPQTREAGLVLLGDVIEASCRTLTNPTPSRINNLVRERIERIFMDGQLDECELTLRDLNSISESFTRILNGIFHSRIDYPLPNIREFKMNGANNHDSSYRKQTESGKN